VIAPDLTGTIVRRIRAEGPLSVASFMAIALHDPEGGYYARRSPIGAAGDFITAPEISQVFGELLGLWCADLWQRSGRPEPVALVELGPGRGTLLSDVLRAAAIVPDFRRALRLHLIETSPPLRAQQQRRLAGVGAVWGERIEDVPPGPALVLANEFFDALPVRQFVRQGHGWAERLVGLGRADRFVFVEGPESQAASLLVPPRLRDAAAGTVVEICSAGLTLAATLAEHLMVHPGAVLLIDYGSTERRAGASLRAVRDHRAVDVLNAPGMADLSADVDFAALAETLRAVGLDLYGPVPQGAFLRALGAEARLAALCAGTASPECRAVLEGSVRRLIDPDGMGKLFKVMAAVSPGLPSPAGFAAEGMGE
jgi:NADH dehydrogenase [ubiquinone] 1 alpha subcomplex assembly factor 7